jgi:hypothetical protein
LPLAAVAAPLLLCEVVGFAPCFEAGFDPGFEGGFDGFFSSLASSGFCSVLVGGFCCSEVTGTAFTMVGDWDVSGGLLSEVCS